MAFRMTGVEGTLTGQAFATLVEGPPQGSWRIIRTIHVYNGDNIAHTLGVLHQAQQRRDAARTGADAKGGPVVRVR